MYMIHSLYEVLKFHGGRWLGGKKNLKNTGNVLLLPCVSGSHNSNVYYCLRFIGFALSLIIQCLQKKQALQSTKKSI